MILSPATEQLIDALRKLQGVGPKTAQRMAFQLLGEQQRVNGRALAHALNHAIEKVSLCQKCRCYTEHAICNVCQNPGRNSQLLCIVETPSDIIAIEDTHCFKGLYYVLHGHLSPLDGIAPKDIGIPQLIDKITNEDITEVIIATNPTMEGKATAHYIMNHTDKARVTCSQLAYGIPLGGELEYLDGGTLAHALQSRTTLTIED